MSELWNEAELKRPPLVTVDVPDVKFAERLHQTITMCMGSNQEHDVEFAQTAAMLSRLIARRKNSFRRMKGFRNLLKLNSMTCRLLRADLPRDVEIFCGALPDVVYTENSVAALPTKNCLDYVLLRLLSVYHIQRHIHDSSIIAADYFFELIRANNFFDISTLLLAVLAKLRSVNVSLGNKYIDLYCNLLKYRHRFPMAKRKSLIPNTTEIPEKLDRFELPLLESEENLESAETSTREKSRSLPAIITANSLKMKKRLDIGTELERKTEKEKAHQQLQLCQLKTIEDVKSFIAEENKARKKSQKSCVAHRIPNHLWTGAQKIFERKLQAGETKKALNVFIKFLNSNL